MLAGIASYGFLPIMMQLGKDLFYVVLGGKCWLNFSIYMFFRVDRLQIRTIHLFDMVERQIVALWLPMNLWSMCINKPYGCHSPPSLQNESGVSSTHSAISGPCNKGLYTIFF